MTLVNPCQGGGPSPGGGDGMVSICLQGAAAASFVTTNVNSTAYIQVGNWTVFRLDFSQVQWNQFRIQGRLVATAAGQSITMQLAEQADPTTPLSAAGDDLVVTDTAGFYDSDWIDIASPPSGDSELLVLAMKGSNGSVDLNSINLMVDFRYVAP